MNINHKNNRHEPQHYWILYLPRHYDFYHFESWKNMLQERKHIRSRTDSKSC
jgi:hypothetical protein